MNVKRYVKYLSACFMRIATRGLFFLPVKQNRILFNTYDGRHICCNPKAIFEELIKMYPGQFEYVWTLESDKELRRYKNENVRYVSLRSPMFYIMKATSKVCVVNSACFPEIPLRRNQFQVYTHHGGGAYKTAGAAIVGANTKSNIRKLKWDAANISLFLSSSKYFTDEVVRKQKLYDGEVYEYGMPRNDKLITGDYSAAKIVRKHYRISPSKHIVLYAPTYKAPSDKVYEAINIAAVLAAAKERFGGDWIFMARTHYLGKTISMGNSVVSANDYPDMQDLLAAADILISDYSSSIWDYSFTCKPCLLYTPDVNEYISNRGLDTPIETWGFPICKTNKKLCDTLINWNAEDYKKKMEAHHLALQSYESGTATEKVCRRIYNECFK